MEIYKELTIHGFDIKVSNKENVLIRQSDKDGIFKPASITVDFYGYKKIQLYKDKKAKVFRVSNLVARLFVENPEKRRWVGYKDSDKMNCAADNLEWRSENIKRKKPVKRAKRNKISPKSAVSFWENFKFAQTKLNETRAVSYFVH